MFNCERCGSRFSPERAASIGDCPRCKARDQVSAPLSFKAFDAGEAEDAEVAVSPPPSRDAVPPRPS